MVGKYIYANKFTSSSIFKINIESGEVVKEYDMTLLKKKQEEYVRDNYTFSSWYDWNNNVLNGIAYRKETNTFFLGGKNWNYLFEIELKD